jgi:hypothetical protein
VPGCTSWQRRAGELGDAHAGLDRDGQQRVVAPSDPVAAVRRVEQRVDFVFGEVGDDRAVEALGRHGEDPADERRVLGMAQRGEPEQRVDRRQPGVAGARAVAAVVFEVVEERLDQRRVEILDLELARLLAGALLGEGEQQPEGVAVCGDRVLAGALLVDQPLGEERLKDRGERAHDSEASSRRSAASASSSGAADRYQ